LAENSAGEPVTSADAARAEDRINLRFADGKLQVRPARGGRKSE
jgi:exonuclease VII large subunit